MSISPEEFLDKKVRPIFEPLIASCIFEKPESPILHMINFLEKLQGTYVNSTEKIELENLRKEMSKYLKLKLKHSLKEEDVISEDEEDNDNNEEEQREFEEKMKKRMKSMMVQRPSVSAEAYGVYNKKEDFKVKIIKKSEEVRAKISDRLKSSFLFNNLEEKDMTTVIDAMGEKFVKAGERVITQGESGDDLYIVESGILKCYKTFNKEDGEKEVRDYIPGEVFGELALLYNAPRAATINALKDSQLWTLDRETFNTIVKDSAMKKRALYEKFLKSVSIFSTIDNYEISQIADSLLVKKFKAGDIVIKQNEPGNEFYIVEEGELEAIKFFENEGKEEVVLKYQSGNYFGELALIKNEPRAATVKALTNCRLLSLDRLAFKRLLGPIENLLKRNFDQYVKYIQN